MLPKSILVKDKLTPEFLLRLLEGNPHATLAGLSDVLRIEYSFIASTTALCRAFKRAGIDRRNRKRMAESIRMDGVYGFG